MALPTLQDAKDYARVETTAADALIASLLARAKASIETWAGYPLIAVSTTHSNFGRQYGELGRRYAANEIQLPGPFALIPAPVVTDVEGVVIDATTYVLDNRAGRIRSKYGGSIFRTAGAYSVVATIGLSAHPDYATRLESVASTAIVDLVAHWYQNRNPMIGDELGQGINSATPGIPPRILNDLMELPGARGLICA